MPAWAPLPLETLSISAPALGAFLVTGVIGTIGIALSPALHGSLGTLIHRAHRPGATTAPALGPTEIRPEHGSRQSQDQAYQHTFIDFHQKVLLTCLIFREILAAAWELGQAPGPGLGRGPKEGPYAPPSWGRSRLPGDYAACVPPG
jgi:hypothetical protein